MGVVFGIESMRRIRDAQNNQNSRKGLSENLSQDDEIEETYWGTLCISNIQTFLLYQDGMNYNYHFTLFDQGQ